MKTFVKPKLFISACIEFDECRYDGSRISDEYVSRLKEVVEVIRVCPELAIGLPSPRDALRLVERKGEELKFLTSNHGKDYTEDIISFSERYANNLRKKDIDGFILKAKSPTCGLTNVKVYYDIGKAHVKDAKRMGMFTSELKKVFPTVPMETERRLSNFNIRDRFYTEIFTLAAFREMEKTAKQLVAFHSHNKYLFMSYQQSVLKDMGRIVANHEHLPIEEVYRIYEEKLRLLLSKEPTKNKRINVLTHIYGYFKREVSTTEKEYYFELMNDYLNDKVPYSNILTILRGWMIRFDEPYLRNQTIFEPYPKELIMMLDSGKSV